ncbi:hypothetical protein NDA18_006207 [Ustilago nuda]|nr:hypothetical protein NDA18_006207 [Ustilago nuda]
MKLLPTFSVLLIAVQMIAAVQLDQLQQPRFVKVRRNLSNDAGSSETQRSLERRNAPEFVNKVEEAVAKFESLSGHSGSQKLQAQRLEGHDQHLELQAQRLEGHDQHLELQAQRLDQHEKATEEATAKFDTHNEKLKYVQEALKRNKKKMKALAWGLGATAVTATGTGLYYIASSNNNYAGMSDQIQAQQSEINKLKALNGQQGGAMQGQGVTGTAGRGDGGIV